MTSPLNRRDFLGAVAGAGLAASAGMGLTSITQAAPARKLKVAAVVTEFTYRSHAHVILENFLEPYYFNGKLTDPGCELVGMYVDQHPEQGDMSHDVAKQYKFPLYPTIEGALTRGGKELAVDAVLSIGEHGSYPYTDRRQMMYPRKRFFDEIVKVFRSSGRVVPLFNDKHLTYRWDWSVEMMETARTLKIPFMAGSSVTLAQRRPPISLSANCLIDEALTIHGGSMEGYDFHGLELLQSMVEFRRGGETGVADIQLLEGDAVWKAADEGRWTYALAESAMKAEFPELKGHLRDFLEPENGKNHSVHAILITYRDGLRATVLRIGESAMRWNFACRLKGETETLASSFYVGPWLNRNLFKALAHAIQTHFRDGRPPYPVERTHLVTGMLAAAMDSWFEKHKRLPTPHLNVAYTPRDFTAMREMGASWKIITEDQPEPPGINPGGPREDANGR